MHALTFQGKEQISYEAVPDPELTAPTDVIVKVEACAICGSDLHPYFEREKGMDLGCVMGHEFMGEIVEKGNDVRQLKIGERVMSPFTSSCGTCFYCRRGLTSRCLQNQLFGWVQNRHGLHGGQAEYVRVPLADTTLVPVPGGMPKELALLLGDILSTGYFCADQGGIHPDDVQVIVGCGPVGLMALWAARRQGAEQIYVVDQIPERLAIAKAWGAEVINFKEEDPRAVIDAITDGRGADVVMEVVGNHSANRSAFELVRPGGVISAVGVCTDSYLAFSPVEAYDKNITYKIGRCPARYYMEQLIEPAWQDAGQLTQVFTHHLRLEKGAEAYRTFAQRADHCLKVVLEP